MDLANGGAAAHDAVMRRRSFLALGLAVGLSIAGGRAVAQRTAAAAVVSGTIDQINTAQSSLVVRAAGGTRAGRLTPQTVISIDGMPGDVRDLRPGQSVSAHFAVTSAGAARADLVRVEVRTRAR